MTSGQRSPRRSKTWLLSVVTFVGMFVVNTLGFTDTVTGSAMGCGRNWPLCNGQWIPSAWSQATLIEYTHRLSVVVGGILLLALAVAALRNYGQVRRVRWLVGLSIMGVVLEGGLGALAVLFVNPPAVMALHMGIALISFVAIYLLMVAIGQMERPTASKADNSSQPQLRTLTKLTLWSIAYGFVAIYIGAFVASTGYGGSFQGWPIPTESPALVGAAFWVDLLHRSVALGYLLLVGRILQLAYRVRRFHPHVFKTSIIAFVLLCLQALSGGLLIATHLNTYAFLFHVSNVSFLFALQCQLGMQVLQLRHTGPSVAPSRSSIPVWRQQTTS